MARILIVDDEEMIRAVIREYAVFEGHQVEEADNGAEALERCKKSDFDVIVMDLMMPGMDGFTTYEYIKKIKDIPVLILSAKGQEYDKLYGFALGIDDYVVKPFSPKELMARLSVIVSRNRYRKEHEEQQKDTALVYYWLRIDPEQYVVTVNGKRIDNITRREFELLYFLASHPKLVFSREQLLNSVWGYDYVGDSRTVDTHVKMLRQSLGDCKEYILTVRGIGYKFDTQ